VFGSHLSIAGSLPQALRDAEALGLDTVQVFTKNQQQWAVRPLDPGITAEWTSEQKRLGWTGRTVSHASYLINLASPDPELWKKSVALMLVEVERCEALQIPFLVHHPGAAMGATPDEALARIAAAYKQLLASTKGYRTTLCLENTVGAGTTIGRTFDELASLRSRILAAAAQPARVGFCFDTCHAHAAGYDFSSRPAAESILADFDRLCGLANLKVLHLNDSKAPAASRRDLHAHIGEGTIGSKKGKPALKSSGFAAVVNHPALAHTPKIMETPKGKSEGGIDFDTLNLRRLKRLMQAAE
jgi:deoxyribonuclease-4